MSVKLEIEIYREDERTNDFFAKCSVDKDEIVQGYGKNPYEALRDLVDEIEEAEWFRPE